MEVVAFSRRLLAQYESELHMIRRTLDDQPGLQPILGPVADDRAIRILRLRAHLEQAEEVLRP